MILAPSIAVSDVLQSVVLQKRCSSFGCLTVMQHAHIVHRIFDLDESVCKPSPVLADLGHCLGHLIAVAVLHAIAFVAGMSVLHALFTFAIL